MSTIFALFLTPPTPSEFLVFFDYHCCMYIHIFLHICIYNILSQFSGAHEFVFRSCPFGLDDLSRS